MIPGHTDYGRLARMRALNRPEHERGLLVTFHGRHAGLHEGYRHCAVRSALADLAALNIPHVDIGGFVGDYLERVGPLFISTTSRSSLLRIEVPSL